MAGAQEILGTVFQDATATFLARVEDSAGTNLTQAAVASLLYTVSRVGGDGASEVETVLGHESIALDKTAVVFDTLQTDAQWTVDATGYNFRHEMDVSQYEAFPEAGETYQVRYEVVPTSGQKIVFRFRVRCI